jgi:hypothetical protein
VKAHSGLEKIEHQPADSEGTMNDRFAALRRQAIVDAADEADSRMATAPRPAASGLAVDDVVRQFAHSGGPGIGGLFVRGIESLATLRTFVESIPEGGASLETLKARKHNLEKHSYVRADTTMRIFGGRGFGLLVDPNKVTGHVRFDDGRPAIWTEDGVTTGSSKPTVAADLGRDGEVGALLDAMIGQANTAKRADATKISNWNEVEILTAPRDAYVGLFYSWPSKKGSYDQSFPEREKADLAKLWRDRTGQDTLRIYLYLHRGTPVDVEARKAQAALGRPGASTLALQEEIRAT